jgi:hypothetical protein
LLAYHWSQLLTPGLSRGGPSIAQLPHPATAGRAAAGGLVQDRCAGTSPSLVPCRQPTRRPARPGACFRYPGIQDVEHVYFYAATSAPPGLIQQYLEQAYQLGRDFERPAAGAGQATPAA